MIVQGVVMLAASGRRVLSAGLAVLGAVVIFLAPDHIWIGGVMAAGGVAIELFAILIAHKGDDRST
jgi:hypothetical protein